MNKDTDQYVNRWNNSGKNKKVQKEQNRRGEVNSNTNKMDVKPVSDNRSKKHKT